MTADETMSHTPSAEGELLFEQEAGIVRLTLNRPEKRNALSRSVLTRLRAAQEQIRADVSARVVVVASAGDVFCAGHDLAEMPGASTADYRDLFEACTAVMLGFRQLPQPVIARVQGLATAAGCQLVASCDLAVAASAARFATPGVRIGLFCTTPMVPLVRAVPPKLALEMLLTGEPISSAQALAAGLINRVVPADQLDTAVQGLCIQLLASSPAVLRLGKKAFYDQLGRDEVSAYARAVEVMVQNAEAAAAQEGMRAFLEKRKPAWPAN
jgi:enoyl-CoA hydratase/carnithine racemase